MAHGRIVEQGPGAEVLARDGPTRALVTKYVAQKRNEAAATVSSAVADAKDANAETDSELDEDELEAIAEDEGKRETVRWGTYGFYFRLVGRFRAVFYLALCATASLIPLAINIYQNYWAGAFVVRYLSRLSSF
jgi:hypothetical protein